MTQVIFARPARERLRELRGWALSREY